MMVTIDQRFKAPVEEVYAWCTDFQDSDPELSHVRLRTRRVLVRGGTTIEMDETGRMGFPFAAKFHVQLRPPDGWEADARSNMGRTRNTYSLFAEPGGTRLHITFDVHLGGPYFLMTPFARGFMTRRIAK